MTDLGDLIADKIEEYAIGFWVAMGGAVLGTVGLCWLVFG